MTDKPASLYVPPVRKAQCTHINVDRVYGTEPCQICGRIPPTGFLYTCRQDNIQQELYEEVSHDGELLGFRTPKSMETGISRAQKLGMSNSILRQMKEGKYTLPEIGKLIFQRTHALNIIETVLDIVDRHYNEIIYANESADRMAGQNPNHDSPIDEITAINSPAAQIASDELLQAITVIGSRCNMKVCYCCRPYMRDRFYSSIESMMDKDFSRLQQCESFILPVHNAATLKELGKTKQTLKPFTPSEMSLLNWSDVDFPNFLSQSDRSPTSPSGSEYSEDSVDEMPWSINITPSHLTRRKFSDHHQTQLAREYSSLCIQTDSLSEKSKKSTKASSTTSSPRRTSPAYRQPLDTSTPLTNHGLAPSTTPPSSSVMTPLTPLHQNDEECFEESWSKLEREASLSAMVSKTASRVTWPPLAHGIKQPPFDRQGDLHVNGGIAVTEEAVETGIPDVFTL